jgi:hypothetical protein
VYFFGVYGQQVKMAWLVFGGYIKFLAIAASFLLEIIVLNAQYIR